MQVFYGQIFYFWALDFLAGHKVALNAFQPNVGTVDK